MSDREECELRGQRYLESSVIRLVKERKPASVETLVRQATVELQIPENEIVDCVLQLQARGEIRLMPQREAASQKTSGYLRRSGWNWYVITVVFLILTTTIVIVVPEKLYPVSVLRQIFGSTFVLWWPGFSLVKALFPSNSQMQSLAFWEQVAFSICMSLAIASVASLILNYTPWGVRLIPLATVLVSVAMFFATIGLIREYRLGRSQAESKSDEADVLQ